MPFLSFRHLKHEQTSLTFVRCSYLFTVQGSSRLPSGGHAVHRNYMVEGCFSHLFFLLLSFHLSAIINADTK